LAHLDIVHTRDFHLASHAVERGLEVIYEDHNEPQNQSFLHADRSCFFAPNFRLAVASTERVRDRLIRWGAPLAKTAVGHSGLNAASLQEVPEERQTAIRAEFLGQHCTHLLAYAGGLHSWRGIRHLRQFAQEHPHCAILVLGGSAPLSRQLRKRAAREGLRNFHVLGYRPQQEVPLYLQAADALLLPYRDPHEAFVTSPLKFFEYLASGRPIAAARLPELAPFARQPDLAIEWCGIDDYAGFAEAVERALATPAEALPTHCRRHRELAHGFVWEERQRALCAAAGLPFLDRQATADEVDEAPCAPFSHRRDAGRFSDAHSS
ncbi:MAG: glycosyltransferase, partial [Opitutales bacterium]